MYTWPRSCGLGLVDRSSSVEELDGTADLVARTSFVAEPTAGFVFRDNWHVAVPVVLGDGRVVLESASPCLLLPA